MSDDELRARMLEYRANRALGGGVGDPEREFWEKRALEAEAKLERAYANLTSVQERSGKLLEENRRLRGVPVEMSLACPRCHGIHVDKGEWAEQPHCTHRCTVCDHEWQPHPYPTMGMPPKAE